MTATKPTLPDEVEAKLQEQASSAEQRWANSNSKYKHWLLSELRAAAVVAVEHDRKRIEATLAEWSKDFDNYIQGLRHAFYKHNEQDFDIAVAAVLTVQVRELNKASEAYRKLQAELAALRSPLGPVTVGQSIAVVDAYLHNTGRTEGLAAATAEINKLLAPRMAQAVASFGANLEAGYKGKPGIWPDWVNDARRYREHCENFNSPSWLGDLHKALGWQGGTAIDAIKAVWRLVEADKRTLQRAKTQEAGRTVCDYCQSKEPCFDGKTAYGVSCQHPAYVSLQPTAERDARIAELEGQRDKLQAFKDWVHAYLDKHGVPHHPPGTHGAAGCRIGDRMDWLMAKLKEAEEAVESVSDDMTAACNECDRLRAQLTSLHPTSEPTTVEEVSEVLETYCSPPGTGFVNPDLEAARIVDSVTARRVAADRAARQPFGVSEQFVPTTMEQAKAVIAAWWHSVPGTYENGLMIVAAEINKLRRQDWPEVQLHPLANVYKCEGKHCQAVWIRRPIGRDDINSNEAANHGWTHGEWHDDAAIWLCPHCSTHVQPVASGMTVEQRLNKEIDRICAAYCQRDDTPFLSSIRKASQKAVAEAVAAERERYTKLDNAYRIRLEAYNECRSKLDSERERHAAELARQHELTAIAASQRDKARAAALEECQAISQDQLYKFVEKQDFHGAAGCRACVDSIKDIRQLAAKSTSPEMPDNSLTQAPDEVTRAEIWPVVAWVSQIQP